MGSTLISFTTSFVITFLIIRYQHLHSHLSSDSDLQSPQKFHSVIVPRIGGVAIIAGMFISEIFTMQSLNEGSIPFNLLLCSLPAFAIALTEDFTKKIGIKARLLITAMSALMFIFILGIKAERVDVPYFDILLAIPLFSSILTIFSIVGLTNSYNIIDGFNGLASMVGILTLLSLGYVGIIMEDDCIIYLSFTMAGSIFGFFIWNFPKGLIFLGDGGAYLIGFWLSGISIILVSRHQEISPWFALTVNGYPIVETLFSIFRRRIHQGKNPGTADGLHFHTIIFRRLTLRSKPNSNSWSKNSRTSPYLWLFSIFSIIPSVLWMQSTKILITIFIANAILYVWLYSRIIKFKTPKWFLVGN